MSSVTRRIKEIKQPRGGYLPPRTLTAEQFGELPPHPTDVENVHASIVGSAVDYLTRFIQTGDASEAFHISTMGAMRIANAGVDQLAYDDALYYVDRISTSLDAVTIDSACKLAGYDVGYRSQLVYYTPVDDISPNSETIENIRAMVKSAVAFHEAYGPVIAEGICFPGAYTELVTAGDLDFITDDAVWDFKVSKTKPTKEHTLQLLMYYLMGRHCTYAPHFDDMTRVGIYNPRLATVFTREIADIDPAVLHEIETEVIGYADPIY